MQPSWGRSCRTLWLEIDTVGYTYLAVPTTIGQSQLNTGKMFYWHLQQLDNLQMSRCDHPDSRSCERGLAGGRLLPCLVGAQLQTPMK
jgi:hypothetical protein